MRALLHIAEPSIPNSQSDLHESWRWRRTDEAVTTDDYDVSGGHEYGLDVKLFKSRVIERGKLGGTRRDEVSADSQVY